MRQFPILRHLKWFAALGLACGGSLDAQDGSAFTVSLRDFGATGDGKIHSVSEWIDSHRFANLRALQKVYPFVDSLSWTIDEAAFESAKLALPTAGGTIRIPAGHYISGRHGWRIWRDNVRLLGDGAETTTLSTAPNVEEGMVISPYRHVGWLEGATREFPFAATSGARGESFVKLTQAHRARAFQPGELVFIRNGANRFDQDYGEFNEIASIEDEGRLTFKFPLARDYTLARFNWAAEVTQEFELPREGKAVNVAVRTGEGFFLPPVGATISIGENVFRVEKAEKGRIRLSKGGHGNEPAGTVIRGGAKIGKARTIVKLTRTSRNFRCERLQIVGRRKTLNLSNSFNVAFTDCVFLRDAREGNFRGGLTIDGDGGRFARFDRCTLIAEPAAGMQFARSFGSVVFSECHFVNANVSFTEFSFDASVVNCTFEVAGTRSLTNVIIAGKSCGDLRFIDNQIRASGVATIFDTVSDIHSQKHGAEGDVIVRGNKIQAPSGVRVFTFPKSKHVLVEDNHVTQP